MSVKVRFCLEVGVLCWALSACDRKAETGRISGAGLVVNERGPLVLALNDEVVGLEVRVESPGKTSFSWGKEESSKGAASLSPVTPDFEEQVACLDPGEEWSSERQSEVVGKRIRELIEGHRAAVLSEEFVCSSLRPVDVETGESHGGIQVIRPPGEIGAVETYRGTEGFVEACGNWLGKDPGNRQRDFKFKVVGLQEREQGLEAEVMVEVRGVDGEGRSRRQVNALWHTRWTRDSPPRLSSLQVRHYEESLVKVGEGFEDLSQPVLGSNGHFDLQVNRGIEDWAARLTRLGDFSLTGHHGLAVGDVNGDGRDDLYVCDGGSLPNRLYLQQADGTAVDVSAQAGVDWLEDTRSALLVDLDNDGDQDLVLATIAMVVFLENDGDGIFALRGGHPGARYPFSLSAADFDHDGLLDLYVCVYSAGDRAGRRGFEANSPLPFHDAENGGRNVLLKNLGDFGFADATSKVGLEKDNRRWSFAAAWEDYDRDGDLDLYVANDFGRNCLYRNDGGHFEQVAAALAVEDMASGMSVAWSDYNRDGFPDLYVGNMFSAAGNRISRQEIFKKGAEPGLVRGLQRMARGNTLFSGTAEKTFVDLSVTSRAHLGGWSWSSGFVDVNNDGWEDLVIANGFLTGRKPDDL